jgi:hypothetical protein
LQHSNFQIFNPRRAVDFDFTDTTNSTIQIVWEHYYLNTADILVFWFPNTSVCPITLFEYGKWLGKKPIYLGIEDGYSREHDLYIQTLLETGITPYIYRSIDDIVVDICNSDLTKVINIKN